MAWIDKAVPTPSWQWWLPPKKKKKKSKLEELAETQFRPPSISQPVSLSSARPPGTIPGMERPEGWLPTGLGTLAAAERGFQSLLGIAGYGLSRALPGQQRYEEEWRRAKERGAKNIAQQGLQAWQGTALPSVKLGTLPWGLGDVRIGLKGAAELANPIYWVPGVKPIGKAAQMTAKYGKVGAKVAKERAKRLAPEVEAALRDIAEQGKPMLRSRMGTMPGEMHPGTSVQGGKVPESVAKQVKVEPAVPAGQARGAPEVKIIKETDALGKNLVGLQDKWKAAKTRNSSTAGKDLDALEKQGFEVDDARTALDDYKGVERSDYVSAEEFAEARSEAWDEFVNSLDGIEVPEVEIVKAVEPAVPAGQARVVATEKSMAEQFNAKLDAGSIFEGGEVGPDVGYAWRSMGPKEYERIITQGAKAGEAQKGGYWSWFPGYSAKLEGAVGRPKFLVEVRGKTTGEGLASDITPQDITGVWRSEGKGWVKQSLPQPAIPAGQARAAGPVAAREPWQMTIEEKVEWYRTHPPVPTSVSDAARREAASVAAREEEIAAAKATLKGANLPPVPKGYVRLYRGERAQWAVPSVPPRDAPISAIMVGGRWFTPDVGYASSYGPNLKYVDVPKAIAEEAGAARAATGANLDIEWSAKALPVSPGKAVVQPAVPAGQARAAAPVPKPALPSVETGPKPPSGAFAKPQPPPGPGGATVPPVTPPQGAVIPKPPNVPPRGTSGAGGISPQPPRPLTMTGAAPPTPPIAAGGISLASLSRSFQGVRISDVPELLRRATSKTLKGKQGKVLTLPGVEQVGKIVNPLAVGSDTPTALRALTGMIDDQIIGGTTIAMNRVANVFEKARRAFQLDTKGLSLAQDIKQIKPLPNGVESRAFHDMVEYAPWYDFGSGAIGKARRDAIQAIRDMSDQYSTMLMEEGILVPANYQGALKPYQIRALQGENGWSFLHRVVTEVKEEAADTLGRTLMKTLDTEGIAFAKASNESNYHFLSRFAQNVADGTITPTPNLSSLLDDFAKLADVKVKKTTLAAQRSWATVAEGMSSGTSYDVNVLSELRKQIQASYELVKKQRLTEAVTDLVQTTTPVERLASEFGIDYAKVTADATNAGNLVKYLQRAIRGEALPGGVTGLLRQQYPALGARLDAAMSLLPMQRKRLVNQAISAAIKATRVTATDATGIADRSVLLSNIKLAFKKLGTKPQITRDDIVTVISQTMRDKTAAARVIKSTYADLTVQQKTALQNILTDAKAMQAQAKQALTSANALKAKLAERMGPMGTAEYGQVIGLPGLGGRYIVSQEGMMGRDFADKLRSYFGYMPMSETDKVIEAVGKVGAVMRVGRLGYDMSATMIQQAMSMGYDLKNLVSGQPTAVWAKATKGAWHTLTSKDLTHFSGYVEKNWDVIVDLIQRGGLVEGAEFTEGILPLQQLATKLSQKVKAAGVGAFIGKHILGRSDAVFTTGRVEAAIEMYKAGRLRAQKAGVLTEWAHDVNLMTGVLSTRGMGIAAGQRSIESAFAFLAPRFTRANASIVYHILTNPGSYTSKEAVKSLAALIAASTAIYIGVNKAQGKDVTLNPLDPNFGKIEIAGNTFRLGGIMSDLRRLTGLIDSATYYATGKNLSLSGKDDNTPPIDRLLAQQFRGKTSPVTGLAIEVTRMMFDRNARNFQGEPITWKNLIASWGVPSWLEPTIKEGSLVGSAGEFVGLITNVIDKPYQLSLKWKDKGYFKDYDAIPTNEDERKAKKMPQSRTAYRATHPETDARLFVSGQVNALQSFYAVSIARRLIQENKIDPDSIRGIKAAKEQTEKRKRLGVRDTDFTPTDRLIRLLFGETPSATPVPVESWQERIDRIEREIRQKKINSMPPKERTDILLQTPQYAMLPYTLRRQAIREVVRA